MAEFTITESNRFLLPGSFTLDDVLTFTGTKGDDTLFAGGGEGMSTFVGTPRNDLYGASADPASDYYGPLSVMDYGGARGAVVVDMSRQGTRTFVDDRDQTHTVKIIGMAWDGYGGINSFAEAAANPGYSSILDIHGSRFGDVMRADSVFLYGGGGNDRLIGNFLSGEAGDDFLFGQTIGSNSYITGGEGNDKIFGGTGDDRTLTGNEGHDFIDAGVGDDFLDGGVGKDVLISGAGNDTINPDIEFYRTGQATDSARDTIIVTRADIGDYNDIVQSSFDVGLDRIQFAAVSRNPWRVYHQTSATGVVSTVLHVDQDRDGFGGATADADDYLLTVAANISVHHGYILS